MEKARMNWIDVAKGIGIISVVLGHSGVPTWFRDYIFSFHMPLFFFLAGYLFTNKSAGGFSSLLQKRVLSLLVPYIIFCIIVYVYLVGVANHFGESKNISGDLYAPLLGILYSARFHLVDLLAPFWFLTCLFVVEVEFYFARKYIRGNLHMVLFLLLCSLLGYADSVFLSFIFPWGIDVAFTAIVFYGIGHLARANRNVPYLPGRFRYTIMMTGFLLLNVFFAWINRPVNMFANKFGNYVYYYLSATAGVFGYTMLARMIQGNRLLQFVGRNSMLIFALHQIGIGLVKGILLYVFKVALRATSNSVIWGFVYTGGSLSLVLPLSFVVNAYVPWMVGRGREKPIVLH